MSPYTHPAQLLCYHSCAGGVVDAIVGAFWLSWHIVVYRWVDLFKVIVWRCVIQRLNFATTLSSRGSPYRARSISGNLTKFSRDKLTLDLRAFVDDVVQRPHLVFPRPLVLPLEPRLILRLRPLISSLRICVGHSCLVGSRS